MKPIVFHEEAKAEMRSAAKWYADRVPGLGKSFREEVEKAVSQIAASPEIFGILVDDIRHHLVHRFPFGLLYRVESQRILILAVMHLHRHPDYWKDRT